MTPDPWCPAAVHGARKLDYRNGCRCQPARAACATYQREIYADGPRTVDATGTRRRIEALHAAGWRDQDIADRLFVLYTTVQKWRTIATRVYARNAALIRDLYDEIGLAEGPSSRTRVLAEKKGWPPPIEWGTNIDDPKAKPLKLEALDVRSARLVRATRPAPMEDVEMLALTGCTWETAAARVGSNRYALERRLYRARRQDLVDRFYRNSESWSLETTQKRWTA